MVRVQKLGKGVIKILICLTCAFSFHFNVFASGKTIVNDGSGGTNLPKSYDTNTSESCKDWSKKESPKMVEVASDGVSCEYNSFFLLKDNAGYYFYELKVILKMVVWHRKTGNLFTGSTNYYVPLEKIKGKFSYCKKDERSYDLRTKDMYVPFTISSGATYITKFNDSKSFSLASSNLDALQHRDKYFKIHLEDVINNNKSSFCPPYIAVSVNELESSGKKQELGFNVRFLNSFDNNSLSKLPDFADYSRNNYTLFDYREPRKYPCQGYICGFAEVLPLVQNSGTTVNYSRADAISQSNDMKELYDSVINFGNCEVSEADKLMETIKVKIKNVNLKGFGGSQYEYNKPISKSGPYSKDTNYLKLLPSQLLTDFKDDTCAYFHALKVKNQIANLILTKTKNEQNIKDATKNQKICSNLNLLEEKLSLLDDLIKYYDNEITYLESENKDLFKANINQLKADRGIAEQVKSSFLKDENEIKSLCSENKITSANNLALGMAYGDENDPFLKAEEEVNGWVSKIGEPEKINCSDFGEGVISLIFKYITIIGVILLIVFGVIDFSKATLLSDDDALKKAGINFGKRVIAAVLLILLPTIVGLIIDVGVMVGVFEERPIECFDTQDS